MTTIIDSLSIENLHGNRDVHVDFKKNATILVSDNGSGKTTILRIILGLMNRDVHFLSQLEFDRIIVKTNKKTYKINNSDLHGVYSFDTPFGQFELEYRDYVYLKQNSSAHYSFWRQDPNIRRITRDQMVPKKVIHTIMRNEDIEDRQLSLSIENSSLKDLFKDLPAYDVFYLPTYRRVEEDLSKMGYTVENDLGENLINFGMSDVENRLNTITSKIRDIGVKWYSKVSGSMVMELVEGISMKPDDYIALNDRDVLKIILSRIGNSIDSFNEDKILDIVQSGQIKDRKYETLAYFLVNLLKVYETQREYDERIMKFVKICNNYLVDKQFIYDDTSITIKTINRYNNESVSLETMSSGEKQIISLFSMLILEKPKNFIVVFDEPELSLSIDWQTKILPDIIKWSECRYLWAATHSPFIFDNELDRCATDVSITNRSIQ